MKKRTVGILIYDYVDLLDFSGPAEVLTLTSNSKAEQALTLYKKNLLPTRPFEVFLVAENAVPIKTHSEIRVEPDLDILIIPGAPLRAVQSIIKNKKIKDWIIKHKNIEYICSVCSGAIILGETGLLNGKKATTHHLALKVLQENYPDIQVVSEGKVIQDSNLITSGGVSSGINMGLYLVEKTIGKTASERTATTIEFEYTLH
ncbi:DJ-1/PfpI family protein [Lysinibacillus pakistanensis]|uniref:DJ-1/PfpI family protein n=1 Tax=Lysinibacillus pakistanensis TaxID=759811 RepID=UPI003D2C3BC7